MTGNDDVVRVENLSKCYLVGHESPQTRGRDSLRDAAVRYARDLGRTIRDIAQGRQIVQGDTIEEFWALKDVSFEVKRGEVVGIVGRNGAGKSTLLKILSRITEPSKGRVKLYGRVASLLEIGTGFHAELTGRENIFLNGAILGMKQAEIRARFDEIVDFAGVERFLDTPVKRYSSGMYVRLAFAVAAHLEPEILVVDEVLAVGDAQFQNKCIGKMKDVAYGGRTVLIVSHYMPMVRNLCTRAIALSSGQVASDGTVEAAIGTYHGDPSTSRFAQLLKDRTDRKGDGRLRFTDAYVVGAGGVRNACRMGEDVQIVLSFSAKEMIRNCDVSIHIENSWNQTVLRLATRETAVPFSNLKDDGYIICAIPRFRLLPGKYSVLVAASVPPSFEHLDFVSDAAVFEVVDDDVFGTGRIPEYGTFFLECSWDHRYA